MGQTLASVMLVFIRLVFMVVREWAVDSEGKRSAGFQELSKG